MILEALKKSQLGQHLTADEAFDTFREIMNGEVTDPVLIGALLTALQMNGPTAEEVTGAARAMRAAGVHLRAPADAVGRKRGLELAKERAFAAAGKPAERDKLARAERQAHIPQGGGGLHGVGKGQVFDAIELHVRASFLCSSTGVRQSRKYASSTLAEYGVSTPRAVG